MKKLSSIIVFIFIASMLHAGQPVVRTGIEVLRDRGFEGLEGKRVGLVTNPSGVDSQLRSTIDILYNAPEVNLVALYGPEHGVRGDVYAGGKINDSIDEATGLPVYSLYGSTRKPTILHLAAIKTGTVRQLHALAHTFIRSFSILRTRRTLLTTRLLQLNQH
jgi:uncharacterized protein YbbC (DUF1343 family)